MFRFSIVVLLVLIATSMATVSVAFAPLTTKKAYTTTTTKMDMAPKYFGKKWVASNESEMPAAGYDVWGTLLRQGPKPAVTRVFQPDDYEQAVLKFMAGDNCDRNTAQGNMDAYLRNPQDWQFARMEDKKRGKQRDYVTLQPKDLILVLTWSSIVSAIIGRAVYCIANGVDFVRIHSHFIVLKRINTVEHVSLFWYSLYRIITCGQRSTPLVPSPAVIKWERFQKAASLSCLIRRMMRTVSFLQSSSLLLLVVVELLGIIHVLKAPIQ